MIEWIVFILVLRIACCRRYVFEQNSHNEEELQRLASPRSNTADMFSSMWPGLFWLPPVQHVKCFKACPCEWFPQLPLKCACPKCPCFYPWCVWVNTLMHMYEVSASSDKVSQRPFDVWPGQLTHLWHCYFSSEWSGLYYEPCHSYWKHVQWSLPTSHIMVQSGWMMLIVP